MVNDKLAPNDQEDIVCIDEGELLVCQNLKVQREEQGDWLRHNIFHTRCTTQGKVCEVIIDGNSFEDVIFADMVHKLQLKTKE